MWCVSGSTSRSASAICRQLDAGMQREKLRDDGREEGAAKAPRSGNAQVALKAIAGFLHLEGRKHLEHGREWCEPITAHLVLAG